MWPFRRDQQPTDVSRQPQLMTTRRRSPPSRAITRIGAVLHPDHLAAAKVLALWSRARPRDYFDVAVLLEHYGRGEPLELAASKDARFMPATLVDTSAQSTV